MNVVAVRDGPPCHALACGVEQKATELNKKRQRIDLG
jgi:hypothetical protein